VSRRICGTRNGLRGSGAPGSGPRGRWGAAGAQAVWCGRGVHRELCGQLDIRGVLGAALLAIPGALIGRDVSKVRALASPPRPDSGSMPT
jgi:hypothetical protein